MYNYEVITILSELPAGYTVTAELLEILKEEDHGQVTVSQKIGQIGVDHENKTIILRGEM